MLIFHYVAAGVIALGAFVTAVGIVFVFNWHAAISIPPESEEEEANRIRMGHTAATLVIVGLLLTGVGVLFI